MLLRVEQDAARKRAAAILAIAPDVFTDPRVQRTTVVAEG